jgi:transposase InsO family protein
MKTKWLAIERKSSSFVPDTVLSPSGDTWENSYHELLTVFLQSSDRVNHKRWTQTKVPTPGHHPHSHTPSRRPPDYAERGAPKSIRVDHGAEFASKAVDRWAYEHKVTPDFSRSGKSMDNAYVESFNGGCSKVSASFLFSDLLTIGYCTAAVRLRGGLGGFKAEFPATPTKVVTLSAGSV